MTQPAPTSNAVDIIDEADCAALVTRDEAFVAVESVFAAMARGEARNFPVVREALGHADALYGFKSGFDAAGEVLGVKSGGYWPGNSARGLTNHQSAICLFDPDTGRLSAIVAGNYLTAIRTAAAAAVSIAHLSRPDVDTLGILGAGHQSAFQLEAALDQRDFSRVIAWNRDPAKLDRLASIAKKRGVGFEAVSRTALAAGADVIITIVSAHEPLLSAADIRPGTHIACMGTDTIGKQEVDPALVAAASLFTDEIGQCIGIGEAQHAVAAGTVCADDITAIGEVINGMAEGRKDVEQITLFDGTSVGLQDLAVAAVAVSKARLEETSQRISF